MIYSFAFVFSLAAAILSLPRIIAIAERLQIYDRPDERKVHNDLTPRIGGIAVALSVIISLMFMQQLETSLTGYIIGAIIVFGFGFYDDIWGLSWRVKFVGQFAAAIIALVFLQVNLNGVQFFGFEIPLPPWLVFTGMVFFIVGGMNSLNLLDGLDGLAAGVSSVVTLTFALLFFVFNLSIYSLMMLIMAGGLTAFLWFNSNPAQVFMGDVGSLAIGAFLASAAVLTSSEIYLLIIGGIYVLETLSVIIQVPYFKLTGGKRIFKMTPIHHHFEIKGLAENKIVFRFIITSIIFSLIALISVL